MALHKVKLKPHQLKILRAIEKDGFKNVIANIPRRYGKDFLAIEITKRYAAMHPCSLYYIFPEREQARKVIWNGISKDGIRLLDYYPDEICKKNNSEMRITFRHNGSTIQFAGSDRYDALRGINAHGVVFSEFAYQNPMALDVLRPVLSGTDAWALYISTPNGRNHYYDLAIDAENDPAWFTMKLTVDDTKHMLPERLAADKKLFSHEKFMQEYYASFDCGQEGSIFSRYITDMRKEGRIGRVLYNPILPVHTAWDIGINDSTVIIYFQLSGTTINIIDYYENRNEGSEHYVKQIKSKPYIYGEHLYPHDVMVREWGTGLTRIEQLENFGIIGLRVPRVSELTKIESARVKLRQTCIDEVNCKHLIRCLEDYHFVYDEKKQMFKDDKAAHNWSSHGVDAFCYLSLGTDLIEHPKTEQDIDELELHDVSSFGPRSYRNFR